MLRRGIIRTLAAGAAGGGLVLGYLEYGDDIPVRVEIGEKRGGGGAVPTRGGDDDTPVGDAARTAATAPETESPTPTPAPTATIAPPFNRGDTAGYVHNHVNRERVDRNVARLGYSHAIEEMAMAYTARMASAKELGHEVDGETLERRMNRYDIDYQQAGENVAQTWWDEDIETERGIVHYDDANELAFGLVKQWLNSEGHRKNLLDPDFEEEGIGLAVTRERGNVAVYACEVFVT